MAITLKKGSKSKKQTGLAITREGDKFTFSWKLGNSDYQVQWLEFRLNTLDLTKRNAKNAWSQWMQIPVKKDTTSKAANPKIEAANFYPNTKNGKALPKLNKIQIRLRGWRKETVDKKDKDIHYYHAESDYATKDYDVKVPDQAASCSESLQESNRVKFSYTIGADPKSSKWFSKAPWQSILLKNNDGNYNDIKGLFKSGTTGYEHGVATTDGSWSKPETFVDDLRHSNVSYTRWFRILAKGPQGDATKYTYAKHVFARPYAPTIKKVSCNYNNNDYSGTSGLNAFVQWNLSAPNSHPVDTTMVQYYVGPPADVNLNPPSTGWTDAPGGLVKDVKSDNALSFLVTDTINRDNMLWVRVEATHDDYSNPSKPSLIFKAKLSDPENFNVDVNQSTFKADITASNVSQVPGAKLAVKYKDTVNYPAGFIIGVIESGQGGLYGLQLPDWGTGIPSLSIQAFTGSYTRQKISTLNNNDIYSYTLKTSALSDEVTDGGAVPLAPRNTDAVPTDIPGTVNVSWEWSWKAANLAELSWADHEDAWTSTNEPSTYIVRNINESAWNISGLETGKTWYFRIRLAVQSGDSIVYGAYCDIMERDLSSAPAVPELELSKKIITTEDTVTAAWGYSSTDGTLQSGAVIALVTIVDETYQYRTIANATTAQHVLLDAKTLGGQPGETYQLAVSVQNGTGKPSGWSSPKSITIAEPIEAAITFPDVNAMLETKTIVVDEDTDPPETRTVLSLSKLPLVVQAVGAGEAGQTTITIERASSYHVERPDESEFDGNEGETIFSFVQTGENPVSITPDNIVGSFDDSAKYVINAVVTDDLGQRAKAEPVEFEVYWNHQAAIPENSTAVLDVENDVVFLDPVAPDGVLPGDVCDIYRLSADKPELLVRGATFGERYVDIFPTIGNLGGYRFVCRTVNGDYIDENNVPAWIDIPVEYKNINHIIDFGTDNVYLLYNVDLSSAWAKDFKETKYLGGSVQGDWNAAVSRTGSISSVAIIAEDTELISGLRRLAVYAGVCRVRTRDGSNYAADVQVSESRGHEPADLITNFSLSITRVDTDEPEGMTYADWHKMHEEE